MEATDEKLEAKIINIHTKCIKMMSGDRHNKKAFVHRRKDGGCRQDINS